MVLNRWLTVLNCSVAGSSKQVFAKGGYIKTDDRQRFICCQLYKPVHLFEFSHNYNFIKLKIKSYRIKYFCFLLRKFYKDTFHLLIFFN